MRLRVGWLRDDGEHVELRFEVADTGTGIPAHAQQDIFTPFVQVDGSSTRRHSGTGLGLAICAELAQLMDGQIGVDSEPDRGSRFHFTARFRRTATAVSRPAPVSRSPLRLLLVDDVRVNRTATAELLRRHGHEVHEAGDGAAALQRLREVVVDALIMDVEMPVMDGRRATRKIRAGRIGGEHLPIVGLSAYGTEEDRRACLEAGMDDYVTKPVDLDQLLASLAAAATLGGGSRAAAAPSPATPSPSQPMPPKPADGVHWQRARELVSDDEELLRELARLFPEEAAGAVTALESGLREGDVTQLRTAAHTLRGLLCQVGCEHIAEDVARMAAAAAGDLPGAQEQAPTVIRRVEAAARELQAFATTTKGQQP